MTKDANKLSAEQELNLCIMLSHKVFHFKDVKNVYLWKDLNSIAICKCMV